MARAVVLAVLAVLAVMSPAGAAAAATESADDAAAATAESPAGAAAAATESADDAAATTMRRLAYIVNSFSGSVSAIDTATKTVTATITVGILPRGVAVRPDGARVYVTNRNGRSVSVIDTATNTVTDTIPVGSGSGSGRVAITPDGTRAYVTNAVAGALSIINTFTNTVTVIRINSAPTDVAFTPDGIRAYVSGATERGGTVSVIDTATLAVTVGAAPAGVAIADVPQSAVETELPVTGSSAGAAWLAIGLIMTSAGAVLLLVANRRAWRRREIGPVGPGRRIELG